MTFRPFLRMRFSVYGVVVGLVLGLPAGVWLSTSDYLLPPFYKAWLRDPTLTDHREPDFDPLAQFNIQSLTVDRRSIMSGGPRKDAIPSLTNPDRVEASEASFLKPNDRVVGVHINGQARAYPIGLLNHHEIVNDELGEPAVPIAVFYCPLCDSVSVVDRRMDGRTLTFGVSGLLLNSNVLMYDREHNALWSQVGLEAISGPFAGRELKHLPWELTTFKAWADKHPRSTVVSFRTGHARDYERNPYAGYFTNDDLYFPIANQDDRLPRKEPVIGIRFGDVARAYPLAMIRNLPQGRLEDQIGAHRVVLESRDAGVAVLSAPPGAQVIHTFWFAWAAFHPETELITEASASNPETRP